MKLKNKFSPDKTFFTSDHHFGHTNVIKHCDRPFKDTEEMDQILIQRWNNTVPSDGIVFHAGDFIWPSVNLEKSLWIFHQLNGIIYLALGNHDYDNMRNLTKMTHLFEEVSDVFQLRIGEQRIFLSHYAHLVWPKSHKGSWNLYGHSHGTLPESKESSRMDIGVDTNNYAPYSFSQIEKIMSKKTFKPVDSHGATNVNDSGGTKCTVNR